jgi:hypothetical protein
VKVRFAVAPPPGPFNADGLVSSPFGRRRVSSSLRSNGKYGTSSVRDCGITTTGVGLVSLPG